MKYTIYIIPDNQGRSRKEEIEIPETISSTDALYMYLKKKRKLPDLNNEEICVCSEDKNKVVTLFVVSQGDIIIYTPSKMKGINLCDSIKTLYLSYYNRVLRAEEIFVSNRGSHYYMWHDGWHDEYSSYEITKEQENEWLIKHKLNP